MDNTPPLPANYIGGLLVVYDFSSDVYDATGVSSDLAYIQEKSPAFLDLVKEIPKNPGETNNIRKVVITDDLDKILSPPFALQLRPSAAASFRHPNGTLYIYLDPTRTSVRPISGSEVSVGEQVVHEFGHHVAALAGDPNAEAEVLAREAEIIEQVNPFIREDGKTVPGVREPGQRARYLSTGECFLAGTAIDMAEGSSKPIEDILIGDWVMSYDEETEMGRGKLVPARVTRIIRNQAECIIDFHGLKMTPGHMTLCADGAEGGEHRKIIDILKSDGTVVDWDGKQIRAATNCPVGSEGDRFVEVWAVAPKSDKDQDDGVHVIEKGQLRAGTRVSLENGETYSLLEKITAAGGRICDDGLVAYGPDAPPEPFLWLVDRLPKPESYVLQLSSHSFGVDVGEEAATHH